MAAVQSDVNAERLRALLHYDPETGVFTWLEDRHGRVKVGDIAGSLRHGYRVIAVDGRCWSAHRLAWLYVHGRHPVGDIDHINLDKADNRLANLREASRSQNQGNVPRQRNNTSGYKGVHWHRQAKKWQARIIKDRRFYSLGLYSDPADAHEAYKRKAAELYSEYARAE